MAKSRLAKVDAVLARAFNRQPVMLPWMLGLIWLSLGYWWIFSGGGFDYGSLGRSLMNTGTAFVTGLLFLYPMRWALPKLGPTPLLAFHLGAGFVFGLAWYVLDISVQGWAAGSLNTGAQIRPFEGPAFLWQTFQGIAVYGAFASLVHLSLRARPAPEEPKRAIPERLLLKAGDEMVTLDPADIVSIVAADDYSEVRTARGNHLVRKRLAAFESELPASFVRVHRSAIVNLDRVARAEPAGGGRITVHLEGSEPITASRAGAKLLRERTL